MYFRDGEYNPNSPAGLHLLAHELTHTIQQRGAKMPDTLEVGHRDDSSEREARTASSQVLAGQSVSIANAFTASVAREEEGEKHHHKGGWLDHLLGLNPDNSFVDAALNPLIGPGGLLDHEKGDGDGTSLLKAAGIVGTLPYIGLGAIGGHALDELNHGPLMFHGGFDW